MLKTWLPAAIFTAIYVVGIFWTSAIFKKRGSGPASQIKVGTAVSGAVLVYLWARLFLNMLP